MRQWMALGLFMAVSGCGLLREPAPPMIVEVPVIEESPFASALAHPRTMVWARRFCGKLAHRPATVLGLRPARPILPRLEAILAEHDLPRELAAVPAIESGYRVTARGRHGELGLWQLQPATARRFGVRVSGRADERAAVDPSTRGAARYLAFLYDRYGDWLLALAAYNAGEGRVDRALKRQPGATFWELADAKALPPISREYVPKILAVVQVTANPDACTQVLATASAL
jgi:membrane-bound lytic murein transglycosylase D